MVAVVKATKKMLDATEMGGGQPFSGRDTT